MANKLIGLTGKAACGKDTVANYLKAAYSFKSVALADPIRAGMRAMFSLEDNHFEHPDKESLLPEYGKSPRQMMQTLGTQYGRECVHQDIWLILAAKQASAYHAEGFDVAITDVRFANEAEWVRSQGGCVWHISRATAGTPHEHASEAGVEFVKGDKLIDNNGTMLQLHQQISQLCKEGK